MSTYEQVRTITNQLTLGVEVSDPSVVAAVNDVETAVLGLSSTSALTDSFAVEQRDDAGYAHVPVFLVGFADNLTTTFASPIKEMVPERQLFQTFNGQFASIVSTSVLDDDGQLGARTVTVHRIDNLGVEQTADFTLDGQTPVILGNTRTILDAFIATAGNFDVNQGVISIYHSNDGAVLGVPGDPAKVYGVIPALFGIMRKSVTLSTTKKLYLAKLSGHTNGPTVIRLEATLLSQCRHILSEHYVDGEFNIDLHSHPAIVEDCYLALIAAADSGTVTISYTLTAFQK